MKKKLTITLISVILVTLVGMLISFLKTSWALENDSRVGENAPITFYIDVMYDGTDREAVTSNNTTIAKVYSDYIYVEDKLPEGLTFEGFVETADGTIGAVGQNNLPKACLGYVVGGVDGLSYDQNTRIVSFKVRNLMAGCKLTVGIKAKTPTLRDYVPSVPRMDFYNTASGVENKDSTKSNTVHFYIGGETEGLYNVSYRYTGDVPQGADALLPIEKSYIKGMSVGVENDVLIDGYAFSGWTSDEVTIGTDRKFIMPEKNITLVGSFTKENIPEYRVHYSIDGDVPDGFIIPKDKSYRDGKEVTLDGLKVGDVVNGYRFLGWNIENPGIDVSDTLTFIMPEEDVNIVGRFEKILYTVSYEFIGLNIPPNASTLLPPSQSYAPGEKVTLATDPSAEGYKFLGWYSGSEFTMPEENVVIQGEWMLEAGLFMPTISKVVTNEKEYYHKGEEVLFEITVKNDKLFSIYDVQLSERLDGAEFVEGDGYTVKNASHVLIDEIPGGTSVKVKAKYLVEDETLGIVTNIVELTGAISRNNYNLDPDGDYEASVDFKVNEEKLYKVTYEFTGDVPQGAIDLLPEEKAYKKDSEVVLENNVTFEDYVFSGWTTSDVEVVDGKFNMPEQNVVIQGSFALPKFNVHYRIEGEIPNEYLVPQDRSYQVGSTVAIDNLKEGDVINGYRFLGWNIETQDVEASDSSPTFVMPRKDVSIVGRFEKVVYSVSYEFTGDYIPENAPDLLPASNTYAPGEKVNVAQDPVLDGYRFLGWTTEDVVADADGEFTVPEKNVVFVGKFEKLYQVSYEFVGDHIPENASDLIPTSDTYISGESVTLAPDPVADGYIFHGWTSDDIEVDADGKFTMPEKDIVIHGEWKLEIKTFVPIITKKILNEKEFYHEGEEVLFEISVKNNQDFAIYDVQLLEKLDGVEFVDGDGYTVVDATHVVIKEILPENEIKVQAKFQVQHEIVKTFTNTVELTGLVTNNNYTLDTDKEHVARVDFNVANLSLEVIKINESNEVLGGSKFGLYQDKDAKNLIGEGQVFKMLEPDHVYYLKEIKAPKGYQLDSKLFIVNVSKEGNIKLSDLDGEMNEGVKQVKVVNKKEEDKNSILDTLVPSTEDNIYTFIGLLIISLVVIVSIVIYFIKDAKKGKKDTDSSVVEDENDHNASSEK